MDTLKYPIGQFNWAEDVPLDQIGVLLVQLEALPRLLANAVKDLTSEQLDSSYRPGGWTIRQVVHHIADAHMNAYIRFKLALTEENPIIKPFEEALWAELADSKTLSVDVSLKLIDAIHTRWVILIKSLSLEQLAKCFRHPEAGDLSLKKALGLYAWHGNHHLAHITNYRTSIGLDD